MKMESKPLFVNPTPVTGRFLCYNKYDQIGRAFLAADLHSGAKLLTEPTITQSAQLARTNRTSAAWATRRQAERAAIEAGILPLVPDLLTKINGIDAAEITPDAELVNIARFVGSERMINAAIVADTE
jgi:hypothetical protein